ncbi:thap domain-containing protein 9 [Holotrichia oblita]|uniref:Thap domain-containing protein 9 n=1 Tax=Holotrichia oblita TaxID=644536 RepID=A0ACB9TE70_HOLOL|nr:thap domain-containing protein 9 [Holotrichia oblita]
MHKYKCKIPGCESRYYSNILPDSGYQNKHFFTLPSDDRQQVWLNSILGFSGVDISLNSKQIYVCEDHFEQNSFRNALHNSLNRNAFPTLLRKSTPVFTSVPSLVSNESEAVKPSCSYVNMSSTPSSNRVPKNSLLKRFNVRQSVNLSPKDQRVYKFLQIQSKRIGKLKRSLRNCKSVADVSVELASSKQFKKLESALSSPNVSFIKSQFQNAFRRKNVFTIRDKVLALAIYKRGPRCYRFLRNMFILPSKSTLLRYLHAVPFDTGINVHIFDKLTNQVKDLMEMDRYCILMFDEMSLSRGFDYCKRYDKVLGYADLGSNRRLNKLADHALVFMVQGLRSSWKQPVAYYFTPSSLSALSLKELIKEVISSLQKINLKVVCTVCDQSSVNSSALSQLAMESSNRLNEDYLFSVNVLRNR